MLGINPDNINKKKYEIVHFIISIVLGVIVYIGLILLGGEQSSRGDGAVLVGILRIMFSAFAAGLAVGFFDEESNVGNIAAFLAMIIGFIIYVTRYLGYSLKGALDTQILLLLLSLIPAILGEAIGAFIKKRRIKK